VLNLGKDSSQKDIKMRYYKLAREHHPDITKGDDSLFKSINEAYSVLSDPSVRKEYDN